MSGLEKYHRCAEIQPFAVFLVAPLAWTNVYFLSKYVSHKVVLLVTKNTWSSLPTNTNAKYFMFFAERPGWFCRHLLLGQCIYFHAVFPRYHNLPVLFFEWFVYTLMCKTYIKLTKRFRISIFTQLITHHIVPGSIKSYRDP